MNNPNTTRYEVCAFNHFKQTTERRCFDNVCDARDYAARVAANLGMVARVDGIWTLRHAKDLNGSSVMVRQVTMGDGYETGPDAAHQAIRSECHAAYESLMKANVMLRDANDAVEHIEKALRLLAPMHAETKLGVFGLADALETARATVRYAEAHKEAVTARHARAEAAYSASPLASDSAKGGAK